MSIPVPLLSDDHLDLLMTAALDWRVLPTTHSSSDLEQRLVETMAGQVGRQIQTENLASINALAAGGQTNLAVGNQPDRYLYSMVDQLLPVEVIKAVHAARHACRHSPTWKDSAARRWLDAILTAATFRLDGFAAAPWQWTRPQQRNGASIGVALSPEDQLEITGLVWIHPRDLPGRWQNAPMIIILVSAAAAVPAELPARAGVFVLTVEQQHDPQQMWTALTSLDMEALSLFWPTCRPWLIDQLRTPALEYSSYRSQP